jgi:hypothetical protein
MLRFLFGGGWWTLWYLFMWFWLLPAAGVFYYFIDFVPGAGPQGGEAIFLLMVLTLTAFQLIFMVNTVVWAHRAPRRSFAYRYLLAPVLAFLAWLAMVVLVFKGTDFVTAIGGGEWSRPVANVFMLAIHVAAVLVNCLLLWRYRRA